MITIGGEIYVVGRQRDPDEPRLGWDFAGVFTQWDLAVAACSDALDFVARVPIDPAGPFDANGFYPHAEEETEEVGDDA